MSLPTTAPVKKAPHKGGLTIVGIYKLFTGVVLLAVSLGLLHYLHRDIRHAIYHVINVIRVDPENRYIAALLAKLGLVDDRHLKELVGLTAVYAVLHLAEGTGLLLRKRWGEYFTVIVTGSLVPLEIYEVFHHFTITRIILLLGNLAIVGYLIWVIRQKPPEPNP